MRDNGNLEVMTLPDFTLKYVVPHFPLLPKVLTCAPRESWASDPPKCSYPEGTPTVSEILMVGLGGKGHGRRPLLMARLSDHEVAIYQAYPFYENCHRDKEGLKVQFKKIPHKLLLRERKGKVKKSERLSVNSNQLRYFNNVGSGQGLEGVFICGPYPHWLILTGRGELRTHPMPIDGSIPCFAAFHNVNCPQGFIYFNRKSELRICILPRYVFSQGHIFWPLPIT